MEPITMFLLYAGWRLFASVTDNWDSIVETTVLAWRTVGEWLSARRADPADVGTIIKERLANGSFRVVGGVFSANGAKRETVAWECSSLDEELQSKLGDRDRITVNL